MRTAHAAPALQHTNVSLSELYQRLTASQPSQWALDQAHHWLVQQLPVAFEQACNHPCDAIPEKAEHLPEWLQHSTQQVGQAFETYQRQRAQQPREYFSLRSQALAYLQRVAPTKLVDGAWLYPVLSHWDDIRMRPLVNTYLEELGEGQAALNHVCMYQRLMQRYGLTVSAQQPDDYFHGVVQMTLGLHGDRFLPELIGYNLGYEKPPLHVLITASELKELGIDVFYFTLHIATDNAANGHARQAVTTAMRLAADAQTKRSAFNADFWHRVKAGYGLNLLGQDAGQLRDTPLCTEAGLGDAVVRSLQRKVPFACGLHQASSKVGHKTVNQWLAQPDTLASLLDTWQSNGWVKRHQDPRKSRFWRCIDGQSAPMQGVFTPFEAQVLYDWIAGEWAQQSPRDYLESMAQCDALRWHRPQRSPQTPPESTATSQSRSPEVTPSLLAKLHPNHHYLPDGLAATRQLCRVL